MLLLLLTLQRSTRFEELVKNVKMADENVKLPDNIVQLKKDFVDDGKVETVIEPFEKLFESYNGKHDIQGAVRKAINSFAVGISLGFSLEDCRSHLKKLIVNKTGCAIATVTCGGGLPECTAPSGYVCAN